MRRLTCGLVVIGLIFLISSCESLVVEEVPTLEREVAVSKTTPSISINNELITLLHIYDEFIQRMRKHCTNCSTLLSRCIYMLLWFLL